MSQTVADFLAGKMHAGGARRIFGYPGGGTNGAIVGATRRSAGALLRGGKG
jgi:hypothetical protein